MNPDLINALFEFVGGLFTWYNAYFLYRAKKLEGVFWPTWLFFTLWGTWNLYFYPELNQMLSFYTGIFLVLGNATWVCLAMHYSKDKV